MVTMSDSRLPPARPGRAHGGPARTSRRCGPREVRPGRPRARDGSGRLVSLTSRSSWLPIRIRERSATTRSRPWRSASSLRGPGRGHCHGGGRAGHRGGPGPMPARDDLRCREPGCQPVGSSPRTSATGSRLACSRAIPEATAPRSRSSRSASGAAPFRRFERPARRMNWRLIDLIARRPRPPWPGSAPRPGRAGPPR